MNPSDKKSIGTWKRVFNILSNFSFIIFMAVFIFLMYVSVRGIITGMEPEIFNHKMYYVESGSMSPTIKVGSLILVEEKEALDINISDILTFKTENGTVVTHRVVDIINGGDDYVMKGDANTTNDPMTLKKQNIIGRVMLTIPYVGFLLSALRTKIGISALIIFTSIVVLTINLVGYYKKNKQKVLT